MPVHPARLPATPSESVWTAIGDLRREVRQARQARSNQPQHFEYNYSASGGPAASPVALTPAGALAIPNEDARIVYRMEWRQAFLSNAISTWAFGIQVTDANAAVFQNEIGRISNYNGQVSLGTYSQGYTLAGAGNSSITERHDVAFFEGIWPGAVVGSATVQPYAKQLSGTASNMQYAFCYFWVAIL